MECNLKRDRGPWTCQVSLRKEYNASNILLPKPEVILFGPRIDNPDDVELMLRRAQTAMLCPWLDPSVFVDMGPSELANLVGHPQTENRDAGLDADAKASSPPPPEENGDDGYSIRSEPYAASVIGTINEIRACSPVAAVDCCHPLKFSRNTVCVEIKDPDAANLSFVDLPGANRFPLHQSGN